ncbi:MAG: glycosyltransferase family 4 protein [Okeania sp. SIO3C4]|nr:glycosyltransferase family 4 protein [Okeania sp. SIO3C4]
MKILLLSNHPPHGGGAANSSQELACELRSIGHEVLQIAPYCSAKNLAEYPGLIWIPINDPWDTLTMTAGNKDSIDRQLLEIYPQQGPFDCVIFGREYYLWNLPAVKWIHSGPVVTICRGGHITHLDFNRPVEPQVRQDLIQLYRDCDLIICIARYLVDIVRKVTGVQNQIFCPNPVNLPRLNSPVIYQPTAKDPIRLLMAAQMKSRKRPLDAVKIVALLEERGVDVRLTVCGSGLMMDRMQECIRNYGLEKRIDMRGQVDRQEVLDLMHQVETVLLCSEREGIPRVLQEAIASGKGVVAYDNPGSSEVVSQWLGNSPLGRIVPLGDPVAASQAILDIADYWRNDYQPIVPPQLPQDREIIYEYESILQTLIGESSNPQIIRTLA